MKGLQSRRLRAALVVGAAGILTSCADEVEPQLGLLHAQVALDEDRTLSALQVPIDLSGDFTDGCASLSSVPELGAAPQACVGALELTGIGRGQPMGIVDFERDGDIVLVAAVVWQRTTADIDCSLGSRVVPLVGMEPGLALLVGAIDRASCADGATMILALDGQEVTVRIPLTD